MSENQPAAIGIWLFIGLVLIVYGLIIFGTGFYHYITHQPFHSKLAFIHPDMVWGGVMFVAGFMFFYFNRRRYQRAVVRAKNDNNN